MQMVPSSFSNAGMSTDAALKEILEIRAAYTSNSPTFKFQHLFLNVVENPAQRVKPANVDEIRWRQVLAQAGGPNNADKYESLNLLPYQMLQQVFGFDIRRCTQ
jgi:hypothetical protein